VAALSGPFALLAQANIGQTTSVVPPGSMLPILAWLATYVILLTAWAVTATRTTMHARVTFGRSRFVRWISAGVGLVLFAGIPLTMPRLLLPSGLLLAIAPFIYSIYGVYTKGGIPLARAIWVGSFSAARLAYATVFRLVTLVAEIAWMVFQALVRLDWAALRNLPESIRRAAQRVQRVVAPDSSRVVTLLQDSGVPLDHEIDPRLKGTPKPVLARLESLLNQGLDLGANYTFLTIRGQGSTEIRFRVDGIVHNGAALSREEGSLVARAIRALAGLPLTGQVSATGGSFPIMYRGRRSAVLVETGSSNAVETVSLRTTAEERNLIDSGLVALGIDDAAVAIIRDFIKLKGGLILFAGRPDSGKSTTLYVAMSELGLLGRSVALVEKSIRHHMDHVAEITAAGSGAVGFPAAIQAALQHQPEVLVVGDIPDRQTADTCAREAAAGRLVLAGVIGDDATDALQRLRSIGVDVGILSVGLKGVVSQRLARVLCESCKASYQATPDLAAKLGLPAAQTHLMQRAVGCAKCRGTGFKGRTGIFEVTPTNGAVLRALAHNESPEALKKAIRASSFRPLKQSAVAKIRQGTTSVEEVIRVMK
jgi:general secretion pathway protein E